MRKGEKPVFRQFGDNDLPYVIANFAATPLDVRKSSAFPKSQLLDFSAATPPLYFKSKIGGGAALSEDTPNGKAELFRTSTGRAQTSFNDLDL